MTELESLMTTVLESEESVLRESGDSRGGVWSLMRDFSCLHHQMMTPVRIRGMISFAKSF